VHILPLGRVSRGRRNEAACAVEVVDGSDPVAVVLAQMLRHVQLVFAVHEGVHAPVHLPASAMQLQGGESRQHPLLKSQAIGTRESRHLPSFYSVYYLSLSLSIPSRLFFKHSVSERHANREARRGRGARGEAARGREAESRERALERGVL
jgi:hypothetical protein